MDEPPKTGSRRLRAAQLIPNTMTLGAICAGLTALRLALEGNVELSVALIVLAAVLDGLDGAMARLLKSESAIGAELDSLADFVNFGAVPGLMVYLALLQDWRGIGWIAVLIYSICCGLRLARFNVESRTKPPQGPQHFVGVPAPGAALLVLFPLVLSRLVEDPEAPWMGYFSALWLAMTGLVMISRFPTPSFKSIRVPRDKAPFLMVGSIAAAAAFLTWPWPALFMIQLGYGAVLIRFALRPPV